MKKNLDFRPLKKNKNKQKRKQEDLAALSPDFYKATVGYSRAQAAH